MSRIALNANASGSGVFTIESPNSDTDRTLNLPDKAGTVQVGEGIDDNATSTAITIDSNENVGIGSASPSDYSSVANNLVVNRSGDSGLTIVSGTASEGSVAFADGTSGADAYRGLINYNHNSNFMRFFVNGVEQVRIRDSYLLVGTTSTTIDTSSFGIRLGVVGHEGKIAAHRNAGGGSACQVFGGNAGELFIMGDGDCRNTNNSYGAVSDERLKSSIVNASSQLDDIMSVQVRSYTLDSTGDTHIGVVAQELEASGMSGLVDEDEEGMKSVKYSVLYMKAIKALQEAVTRIETLEAEVAAFKAGD